MKKIYISGIGHFVPQTIIHNSWFEDKIDTTDAWIFEKVGIRERRMIDARETTSDLAVKASLKAIYRVKSFSLEDILIA
jgi:3-oxoacyl-[acyl-carrier-protein] synthase-3